MALPFLPGNTFNKNLGKEKFHKSHHFDVVNNDVTKMMDDKAGIGGVTLPGQRTKPTHSVFPRGEGSNQPAWVAFDKQVLSFDAYFQESVVERREEQYRVRPCKVYFYLEDDSIQVMEPRNKNSGIPQGTLVRRHRIPMPPPDDDNYFTVEDFNVGREITFYGRTFKLVACDEFTHNFLSKLGVRVPPPESVPSDPYSDYRKALDESMQPLRPYERFDTLKQFLDHDRHVLRFFAYWDDTDSMFGDPRELVLHYFLADDTVEICEVVPANSGRDAAPVFLRRDKLPKDVVPLKRPGEVTQRTVLNVFGPTGHGSRYILDSLKTGAVKVEHYKDSDLKIGAVLNVWGRKVTLCECDNFTKEFYKTKYGIENMEAIKYKSDPAGRPPREMPPYNGFGSEEDSLCSCQGLLPRPPRRDFVKFMEKDRVGLESNVLRFLARLVTSKVVDQDRRFIVSYFLSDDTMLVFEPPVRNSGMGGGKFLERQRVKKPNQERYSTQMSQYYTCPDIYVGAVLDVNSFKFELLDADEYAFRYMESHPESFPSSDVQRIFDVVRSSGTAQAEEVLTAFKAADPTGSGCVSYERFTELARTLAPTLTPHQLMTIARHYGDRGNGDSSVATGGMVYLAQDALRKHNFDTRALRLNEALMQRDKEKNGQLSRQEVLTACKATRIPISRDILEELVNRCHVSESIVDYQSLIAMLDWKNSPVEPPPQHEQGVHLQTWLSNDAANGVSAVCYRKLMEDAFGEGLFRFSDAPAPTEAAAQ